MGSMGEAGAQAQGRPSYCLAFGPSPSGEYLLESSRVFFFKVWSISLYVNLTCGPSLVLS
jgi:hypothetical protein